MRTIVWSYSGVKEFGEKARLPEFSVPRHVTGDFPPAFISVGNADPLLPHSRVLADALVKRGVKVDTLFFPEDYRPALPHEYQFHLDTGAGREALERTVRFLQGDRLLRRRRPRLTSGADPRVVRKRRRRLVDQQGAAVTRYRDSSKPSGTAAAGRGQQPDQVNGNLLDRRTPAPAFFLVPSDAAGEPSQRAFLQVLSRPQRSTCPNTSSNRCLRQRLVARSARRG